MDPRGKGFVAVAQLWFFSRKTSAKHPAEQALADGCFQSLGKVFLDFLQRCGKFTWMLFLRCFLRPKFLQKQVAVTFFVYHMGLFSSLIFVFFRLITGLVKEYPRTAWFNDKRLGFAFVIIFYFLPQQNFQSYKSQTIWLVLKNRTFSWYGKLYDLIGKFWFAHSSKVFPSHFFSPRHLSLRFGVDEAISSSSSQGTRERSSSSSRTFRDGEMY